MSTSPILLVILVLGGGFANSQLMLASQDSQYYACTYVNPRGIGGGFYLGGTYYVDGEVAPIKADETNYTITAREVPGYVFYYWSATRSVTVYDTGSPSTLVSFGPSGWDGVCVGGLTLWYQAIKTTASNSTSGTPQNFSRTLSESITPSATVFSIPTLVLDPQTQFLLALFTTVAVAVFMSTLWGVHRSGKSLRDSCKVAIPAVVTAISIAFIIVGPLSQLTIRTFRILPFLPPWSALPPLVVAVVCLWYINRISRRSSLTVSAVRMSAERPDIHAKPGPARKGSEQQVSGKTVSEPTWDLFICHASEDKEDIARPLAEALAAQGLKVWYDEFTLTLGDSLSRSIDHGLANSRFGVVILSPAFFNKEWPKRELDGLTAKEISSGKTILPIWHNVDREYVLGYSPVLADKLAVSTSEGLDRVVTEIQKAVSKDESLKGALREHVTPPSERPFKEESKAPPSTTAAVEAVKRYLGDSRNRIQLHDLIHRETESVYQELASDQFVSKVHPFTKEIFQQRMHTYEIIVERLVAMMAALSYHDIGDNSNLLSRCIERLAEQMRHDGLVALLELQLYPALLVTYAAGLSALAANRFRNLAAILKDPKYYDRYSGKDKPAIRDVNVLSVFEHSQKWVPRPEAEREYTPANNYLFDLLRPVLREYLPGDRKYEETFDIFEYLLALTYSDIVDTRWAPVGRFGWRVERPGYEATGLSGFVDNGLKLGDAWELLRAGFFDGSVERFKKIVETHQNLLQKQARTWI